MIWGCAKVFLKTVTALVVLFCVVDIHAEANDLSDALRRVLFANSGTTNSADRFFFEDIVPVGPGAELIYLEADNVSCTQCVWSDGAVYFKPHPYLFKEKTNNNTRDTIPDLPQDICNVSAITSGDIPGNDIAQIHLPDGSNVTACAEACCESTSGCKSFVFIANLTVALEKCPIGSACCWIKDSVPTPAPCPAIFDNACQHGTVQAPPPPPPPQPSGTAPASGMRSAVPLGGISTGSVELRGDGSLHEWIIHNAGPSGAAKIQQYPKSFFAMRVGINNARVLQTHPHVNGGAFGVSSIKYQGSHPVSKLTIEPDTESKLLQAQDGSVDLSAALYGFSTLKMGDRVASARPAIAFTLDIHNSGTQSAPVALMMNLPLLIEEDQTRVGTALGAAFFTDTAEECSISCSTSKDCQSWNWISGGVTVAKCQLQSDAPLNQYLQGTTSGLSGTWIQESSTCLTLVRPGNGPMHGNVSICTSSSDSSATSFSYCSNSADNNFDSFAKGASSTELGGVYGAAAVRGKVAAGGDLTLTITMAWVFPSRDNYNYNLGKPFTPYDNHYASIYPNAAEAAMTMNHQQTLDDIYAWQSAFFPPEQTDEIEDDKQWRLPSWLSDVLINSLSHTRDMMWFSSCPHCHISQDARVNGTLSPENGGFWRQFEAYDCPDIDSIHNDGERHIPYIMFFPDGTRSKLAAWAGNQGANGMLAEQILNVDPDTPQGRVMADSSSMFVLYVLELLRWDGDRTSLELYYDTIEKIIDWQLSVSATYGVPLKLETTYDVLKFPQYELSTYSSMFHIVVLKAGAELAKAKGDPILLAKCQAGITRAQTALDVLQWNSTESFYNAGSDGCTAGSSSGIGGQCTDGIGVFSDAFYAQVLAYTSGLGDLLANQTRLDLHQDKILASNCHQADVNTNEMVAGCPYGLTIISGRPIDIADNTIWEMATHDYTALQIQRSDVDDPAIAAALKLSAGSVSSYAEIMNDQWAIAGGKFTNGYPSVTSHYGYHMTVWHVLTALNGQNADLSNMDVNGTASLSFDPKVSCTGTGFQIPFLLPGRIGTVSCSNAKTVSVKLAVGELPLSSLSVMGEPYPGGKVTLSAGEPAISWNIAR